MSHAFTPRAAFDRKAARVVSGKRTLPRRVRAADGTSYKPYWTTTSTLPFGALARIGAAVMVLKLVAVVGMGQTAYDEAIAPLRAGTPVERGAVVLLERGPVTRAVTHHLYMARDAVRRTYAAM